MRSITRRSDTRARMIEGATELFRKRGYSATGFREVIAQTGAPRGSIYHHFPGGKAELAGEVMRQYLEDFRSYLGRHASDGDPLDMLRSHVAWVAAGLRQSGVRAGCPIAAVVVDAPDSPELVEAAEDAFSTMATTMSDALAASGVAPARAASVAALIIAGIQGAVILCRAARDLGPLATVERELERTVRTVLDER